MTNDTIYALWKSGYRTKKICTHIAADFFGSHFREIEYPDMDEEHALQIVYGSSDTLYDEHTAMECIIEHSFYSYKNKNAIEILSRMEAAWDSLHERRYKGRFQKHYKVPNNDSDSSNIDRKTFTFEYKSEDGCWCSRERASRAVIVIDGNKMSMFKIRGIDPTLEQAAAMILAATSRAAAIHEYNRSERVHPYKVNSRIGYSGCEDYFLDIYKGKNNVFTKWFTAAKLHVSMAGKVSEIADMYVGDAIELFTAAMGYRDFDYFRSKISKRYGIHFVRPYKNEILSEEDMDFIPRR